MSRNDSGNFLISEEDWSLHRKGFDDQQRHQKKVQEAIKTTFRILSLRKALLCPTEKMS